MIETSCYVRHDDITVDSHSAVVFRHELVCDYCA
jgi:hypothetical protein